jgi:two-component system sensor kinase FixL
MLNLPAAIPRSGRTSETALHRQRQWWRWIRAPIFAAVYIFLDWVTYIDPLHHLNITPWNPGPALGLLYLLRAEPGGIGTIFAAIVASDLVVRDIPAPLLELAAIDGLLAISYLAMARMLKRLMPDGGMFSDRASFVAWSAVVTLGSLANALVFVSLVVSAGFVPVEDWGKAVLRFWVGDGVGIFVAFPLMWWMQDRRHRAVFRSVLASPETIGYLVLLLASLWVVFLPSPSAQVRYIYVLFLPLVWAASRQGLIGAICCASLLEIGMIVAGTFAGTHDVSVFELQMRSFLLAIVGFLIGVAVDEQRRTSAELRHTLRLAAAGEMAGALAHELNQPLTALSAYGSVMRRLVERDGGSAELQDVTNRMAHEAGRAVDTVKRLKDFFRTGATNFERFPLSDAIACATERLHDAATCKGVRVMVNPLPEIQINADRLQIEVVLRNLISNAIDAVADNPDGERDVSVTAEILDEADQLRIRVEDNGPGIDEAVSGRAFEPFVSTKSSGLGLGLAISRAIAEAHGGQLLIGASGHGCFILTLPLSPMTDELNG